MDKTRVATVYIDGFNLYYGLVSKGWERYKWLDLCAFSRKIIPAEYQLGRVWYFTSRIKGDVAKHERQQQYIGALKCHNGQNITIKYGTYQMFDTHCRHCGSQPIICKKCENVYTKPTEKKTDVNLSTYMLTDCFEKLTDCVVLVSGDSDYEAPLTEIGRLFPLVKRLVAYPPRRRNPALEAWCDTTIDLTEDCFADCQLPNPVRSKLTGAKFTKPGGWV